MSESFRAEQQRGNTFFWKTANLFLTFVQLNHTILALASDSSLMAGPISLYSHSSTTSLAAMFYDTVELKWHYSTVISSCVLYTHPWLTLASHILLWPLELAIDLCVASLWFFWIQDYHAVDILLAEIDVYELFAFKHCVGRRIQLALCKGTLRRPKIRFFWNYST